MLLALGVNIRVSEISVMVISSNKSEIHSKGFAGRFALKERLRGLRVWHMYCTPICVMVSFCRFKVNSDSQFSLF